MLSCSRSLNTVSRLILPTSERIVVCASCVIAYSGSSTPYEAWMKLDKLEFYIGHKLNFEEFQSLTFHNRKIANLYICAFKIRRKLLIYIFTPSKYGVPKIEKCGMKFIS